MAKPLIAVETIYEAALALLDREGEAGLQGRRLAATLKCSTRTLYAQVGSREALVRQLFAHHFGRLELDFRAEPTWQGSAVRWASVIRNALLEHPQLSRLMTVEDRGVIVEFVNQLLRLLLRAGLPPELAMRGCRVLVHTVISLTLLELDTPPVTERRRRRGGREIRFETLLLEDAAVASRAEEFQDTPELFHTAVRWLIAGMEQDLARHAENPPAP